MTDQPTGAAAPAPHLQREYVRWRDVDPAAIMRYDAYLRFVELGEEEWSRTAAMPAQEHPAMGVWLLRKVVHVEYHRPSQLGDRVTIATYLGRLGTTSYTMHVDVLDAAATTLLVAAHVVVVATTRDTYEKVPLPAALRDAATPWVMEPAAARAAAARAVASLP